MLSWVIIAPEDLFAQPVFRRQLEWGEKKEEEKGKKVLTRGKGFGILTKLSARETAPGKRKRKNLLTAGKKCGNLNKLPQYGADRAPKTF